MVGRTGDEVGLEMLVGNHVTMLMLCKSSTFNRRTAC